VISTGAVEIETPAGGSGCSTGAGGAPSTVIATRSPNSSRSLAISAAASAPPASIVIVIRMSPSPRAPARRRAHLSR